MNVVFYSAGGGRLECTAHLGIVGHSYRNTDKVRCNHTFSQPGLVFNLLGDQAHQVCSTLGVAHQHKATAIAPGNKLLEGIKYIAIGQRKVAVRAG